MARKPAKKTAKKPAAKKAASKKKPAKTKKASAKRAPAKKVKATKRKAGKAPSKPAARKAAAPKAKNAALRKVAKPAVKAAAPSTKSAPRIPVGAEAPGFTLPTDGGGSLSLADLKGRPVVLYFYPRDDTPGCTIEACDFRDHMPDFSGVNAAVIGVSTDSAASHDKFKAKYGLPFTLAADENHAVAEAYGVWVEKNRYGRTYMGTERSTFLIDAEGKVARVWRNVKVDGHAQEVLAAARGQ